MSNKVFIIRGLPGAGKSNYVTLLTANLSPSDYAIHSTDHYFYSEGSYMFNPRQLEQFHQQNQAAFGKSLQKKVPLVICDNTNIEAWQIDNYVTLAKKYNYEIEVVSIGFFKSPQHQTLYASRNNHNVELGVIQSMAKKSQRFHYQQHLL